MRDELWVLIIGAALLGVFLMNKGSSDASANGSSQATGGGPSGSGSNPAVTRANPWNLPDVDSSNQKGVYARTYDESMEKASGSTQVPFALIKAHAIRESSLNPQATHYDNPTEGGSYGLMQVEWIAGSDRFAKYGFPDSVLGTDGSGLFDPDTNCLIGASIICDNLNWLKGNLRDTINAYNTGTTEAKHEAPGNYVDDVIGYYSTLVGQSVP